MTVRNNVPGCHRTRTWSLGNYPVWNHRVRRNWRMRRSRWMRRTLLSRIRSTPINDLCRLIIPRRRDTPRESIEHSVSNRVACQRAMKSDISIHKHRYPPTQASNSTIPSTSIDYAHPVQKRWINPREKKRMISSLVKTGRCLPV